MKNLGTLLFCHGSIIDESWGRVTHSVHVRRKIPNKASELGQRGGKAKGPKVTADPVEYVARPLKTEIAELPPHCSKRRKWPRL